jgi:hypothetical protein
MSDWHYASAFGPARLGTFQPPSRATPIERGMAADARGGYSGAAWRKGAERLTKVLQIDCLKHTLISTQLPKYLSDPTVPVHACHPSHTATVHRRRPEFIPCGLAEASRQRCMNFEKNGIPNFI